MTCDAILHKGYPSLKKGPIKNIDLMEFLTIHGLVLGVLVTTAYQMAMWPLLGMLHTSFAM